MSGGPDLEQRYRRVLRLLPGYYRDTWEDDRHRLAASGRPRCGTWLATSGSWSS
jgi:hypothetical protein